MKSNSLTVGMIQLGPPTDPERSLELGIEACSIAKSKGAELILFPEMWNVGYRFPTEHQSLEKWSAQAISETDPYYLEFAQCAKDHNIAIALPYLRSNGSGYPSNSVSVINKNGDTVLTYSKVHTCDFSSECYIAPGDGFPVCEVEFDSGVVKLGAMICYDREFPESARILMLAGAEVILIPNACRIDTNRECQLKTRAYENMVACVMVNYAGDEYEGRSVAFDGVAYDRGSAESKSRERDMKITNMGKEETIEVCTIDIESLRDYRSRAVWGNAYRKPRQYGALTDMSVGRPFRRDDSRR